MVWSLAHVEGPLSPRADTIFGNDFFGVRTVLVGGVRATILRRIDQGRLRVRMPRHAPGDTVVQVVTAYGRSGTGSQAAVYRYDARPQITGLDIRSSDPASRTPHVVLISGHNLQPVRRVLFGDRPGEIDGGDPGYLFVIPPPHVPGTVEVRVFSPGGASKVTAVTDYAYLGRYSGGSWRSTAVRDPLRGRITGISCPATDWCLATDHRTYSVLSDGTWSSPAPLVAPASLGPVSCAGETFCAAVAGSQALTFDGAAWSPPVAVAGSGTLVDVSCPAAGTCAALDDAGRVFTLRAGAWSAVAGPPNGLVAISCGSADFCVGVTADDYAVSYDGSSWASPAKLPGSGAGALVSCGSATFCLAVDTYGAASRRDGTTWSSSGHTELIPDARDGFGCSAAGHCSGFSCSAAGHCMLADGYSDTQDYDTGSWGVVHDFGRHEPSSVSHGPTSCAGSTCYVAEDTGGVHEIDGGLVHPAASAFLSAGTFTAVSCPAASFCAAVDSDGAAFVRADGAWNAPQQIGSGGPERSDVSCASATACLAVTSDGSAARWAGSAWHAVAAPRQPLLTVSCVTARLCLGAGHDIERFDGSGWTVVSPNPIATVGQLSCAAPDFCALVGGGQRAVFDGTTWQVSGKRDASTFDNPARVSCPASGTCVAVYAMSVWQYAAGHWSSPFTVNGGQGAPESVSCASAASCLLTDAYGNVRSFDDGIWSVPAPVERGDQVGAAVSCWRRAACVVVGTTGVYRESPR